MTASRVVTRHMSGANQLGSRPRAGWATEAHGPLECYRDFRQKYARATSQPFRRAAGVFATSTRATGARLKLCQAQAVGRFPAESYSLPIPSFPLQPLRPHNARTRARGRDPIGTRWSRDPTNVNRRKRRASGLLPQLASSAVPEAEAPLPPDPQANLSVEHTCRPEIRVRHDAPAARPC